MTTQAPTRGPSNDPGRATTRWIRRSLLMLPVFVGDFVVTGLISEYVVLPRLGLHEGDLMLMERGPAGWSWEIAFAVVLALPAVLGAAFAKRARRQEPTALARVVLTLHVLLLAVVLYTFADAVHMTYDPQGGWLPF